MAFIKHILNIKKIAITFCYLLCVIHANATILEKFSFKGLHRIEASTVKAYLHASPGEDISEENVNEFIKALYNTGFFSDISMKMEDNGTLVVDVVENPIINRIAFEGNSKLSDDALGKEIKLAPRTVYSAAKIQELQQKMLKMYRLGGRFSAKVDPKIIKLPENRVDVVFEIDEGPSTYIEKIIFQGNRRFSESTLESILNTKESRWYRFLTSNDTYDPDRMAYDQALLKQFYLEHGYIDFKIKSALAELSPDKRNFYLTYVLEEGERYKVNTVKIDNPIKEISNTALEKAITIEPGEWYNSSDIDSSIDGLTKVSGDAGYAFVDPEIEIKKNKDDHSVDIIFHIQQGPKVYIQRINIEGNNRTRDNVIRREIRLEEGDPFNATKLRRSEQRIRNLDFFKTVKITQVQGDAPDKVIINVEVEEKVTGEIQLAVGYGTHNGFSTDVTVRERNFLGKGQDTSVRVRWGQKSEGVDFSFMEPYFWDRNLAAGFNVFAMKNTESKSSTKDTVIGTRLWVGYEINEYLSQNVSYGFKADEISYTSKTSEFIREQRRKGIASSIGLTTVYDRRDSRIEPRSGHVVTIANQFVGVGGTSRYFKNTVSAAKYFGLWKESVLAFMGEYGLMSPLGKTIRTINRFEVGGFDFRGFDFGGIGPRDKRGDRDSLGGLQYYTATTEVQFPVGLPREFGVMGSTFIEAGSLWDAQKKNPNIYDENILRYSVGVGLSWASPMGPIRFDYGKPLKKGKFDKVREFLFGFTTRF